MEEILAKSLENGGDTLINHSLATMNFGVRLIKKMINQNDKLCGKFSYESLIDVVKIATLFHDLGKCNSTFQKKLRKKNIKNDNEDTNTVPYGKNNKVEHQTLSWAFLSYVTKLGNSNKFRPALKAILYHHPIYIENDSHKNNSSLYQLIKDNGDIEIFEQSFNNLKNYLPESLTNKIDLVSVGKNRNEEFYKFCELIETDDSTKEDDAIFFIVRACLIVADRYVSKFSKETKIELQYIIDNDVTFIDNIIDKLSYLDSDFDNVVKRIKTFEKIDLNRFNNQIDIITNDIKDNKTAIVGAAAGFGKTLIGLLWAIYHKKQIMWVCPRNIIAENTYHSLMDELKTFEITGIKIGLFLESEYKNSDHLEENKYDIIVTNIDNFLNPIIKNNMSNQLYNMVNSYVIFDEYHEFVCSQPLFPQFIQLMWIRHNITQGRTLLLSATPVRLDKVFWNYEGSKQVYYKTYKSHAKNRKHQVFCYEGLDFNDIKVENNSDTCVLLNTVPTTQKVSLNNDNVENIFHTRFPKHIIQEKKELLIQNHNKYANINNRFSTISTRIIGTGLDISYSNLIESVLSAETTIQAIGRVDRMSECTKIPTETYYCLNDNSENNMKDNVYTRDLSNKWFKLLSQYNTQIITLQDYYDLYEQFNTENLNDLVKLYKKLYSAGLKQLREMKPYRNYSKDKRKLNKILTPSTNSYRGLNTSLYVCARYRNKNDKQYAKNNVCDNIIVADHVFSDRFNNFNDKEERTGDTTRKDIIKNQAPNWNKDEDGMEKLHYKGTKPPYSYPDFKDLAIYPETPLVMVNFFYNDKIGLYHKDILF